MAVPYRPPFSGPSIGDRIVALEAFAPPAAFPPELEPARAVLWNLAEHLGVTVGLGRLHVDDAYVYARIAAERVEQSTGGAAPWRGLMAFATHLIDTWAEHAERHLRAAEARDDAIRRSQAEALIRLAASGYRARATEQAIRLRLRDAALAMDPRPSVDTLSDALRLGRWRAAHAVG